MITAIQLRMARAAKNMSLRELGKELNLSAVAISRYEQGDSTVIAVDRITQIKRYFESAGIYFGPKNSIAIGENIFLHEKWLGLACYQLLVEHAIAPSSKELLEAVQRARDNNCCGKE